MNFQLHRQGEKKERGRGIGLLKGGEGKNNDLVQKCYKAE